MNEQQEEEYRFGQLLADYWSSRGGMRKAVIQGVEINPFKLYKAVCKRGGARAVSNSKAWREIVDEAVPQTLYEQLVNVKVYYMKWIYPYQKKVYFGYEQQSQTPDIIPSKIKNKSEDMQRDISRASNMQTKSVTYAHREEDLPNLNLLEELEKHFQKEEKEQQLYYLKKSRAEPTIQELKRIQNGILSRIPNEVIYALNILLLYSTNSNNHLLLEQFQNIVKCLETYVLSFYPPKRAMQIQHLRTITLIVRNFCVSTSYLHCILKTELFTTLVDLYNNSIDKECSRNVVDIMTGLVKVGWDCRVIVKQITEGIINDNIEDIEVGVDLIRGLVDQRQETLETVVIDNLDTFAKLFVSSTPEIRETVLQILAYVSDLSSNSRAALARHPYLLQKLIQILSSGAQHFQKLCQLSALTLSNIAVSPGSKECVRLYEKELVIIASSDQRVGNIAAGILSELDQS